MHGLFLLARGPLFMDGPSFEERGALHLWSGMADRVRRTALDGW